MKMIRHLLIFFGIYGFLPSLAFEIQRPKRPKLISIESQQTIFCTIFCTCSWTALLKWLPGGHQIFIFSMVILLLKFVPCQDPPRSTTVVATGVGLMQYWASQH